jgi:hypothetical protein
MSRLRKADADRKKPVRRRKKKRFGSSCQSLGQSFAPFSLPPASLQILLPALSSTKINQFSIQTAPARSKPSSKPFPKSGGRPLCMHRVSEDSPGQGQGPRHGTHDSGSGISTPPDLTGVERAGDSGRRVRELQRLLPSPSPPTQPAACARLTDGGGTGTALRTD